MAVVRGMPKGRGMVDRTTGEAPAAATAISTSMLSRATTFGFRPRRSHTAEAAEVDA